MLTVPRTVIRSLVSGRIKRLSIASITNEYAFSFGPEAWNYIRALVADVERNPEVALEESTFYRFFCHPDVRSVRYLNDILFLHDPERRHRAGDFKFHLGTYPWGDHVAGGPWGHHFDAVEGHNTEDLYGVGRNPWYRPGDRAPLEQEWSATIEVLRALRTNGYRPFAYGGPPEVTLLVRRDDEIRAIRYNGQHRLAVVSQFGYRELPVLVRSTRSMNREFREWPSLSSLPRVIEPGEIVVREADLAAWPYVRHGLCSPDQASEIFNAFFELNGRERIEALGLPPGY